MISPIMSIDESVKEQSFSSYNFLDKETHRYDYFGSSINFMQEQMEKITEAQLDSILSNTNRFSEVIKESLADTVSMIKQRYDEVSSSVQSYKGSMNESATIIAESLNNHVALFDIKKSAPIHFSYGDSMNDTVDMYMESFAITDRYSKDNVSTLKTLDNITTNLICQINKVSIDECGELFGYDPFSNVHNAFSMLESVAIYVSSLCEAVESNYINMSELSLVSESSDTTFLKEMFSQSKYGYKFYDKDSGSDISAKVKTTKEVLNTADKFANTKAELTYINSTLPKLQKTLVNLEFDYKQYCKLSKDEQVKQAKYIDNTEKAIYAANQLTSVFFGGFSLKKPDKYDVYSVKANARYNIAELKRCIRYLEKRKKDIEKQQLKGGK